MPLVSAHELLTTRCCRFGACVDDADGPDGLCSFHRPGLAIVTNTRTCEHPGCGKPTVSSRGPYARVCHDHKDIVTAARRRSGGGNASVPALRVSPSAPEAVEPEPAEEPTVADSIADRATRLAHLTLEIQQTRERLIGLQAEALGILDELREAIDW